MKKEKFANIALWVVVATLFMAAGYFWMTMPSLGFGQAGRVIQQHHKIEFCLAAALVLMVLKQLKLSVIGLLLLLPHLVHLAMHFVPEAAGHSELAMSQLAYYWDVAVVTAALFWQYARLWVVVRWQHLRERFTRR